MKILSLSILILFCASCSSNFVSSPSEEQYSRYLELSKSRNELLAKQNALLERQNKILMWQGELTKWQGNIIQERHKEIDSKSNVKLSAEADFLTK